MKKIRTVTGDVPAEKMGRTLTHEHLLYTYPGGEYDHISSFVLDQAVERIANELKAGADEYKYGTLVDMTPAEVGRHPELMKRVSEKTGVNVIAVTGFFPERMGIPYWFRRQTVEELADFYVRDLTEGMVFARQQDRHQGRRHQDRDRTGKRRAEAEPDRPERPAHPLVRGPADPRGRPRAEGDWAAASTPTPIRWTTPSPIPASSSSTSSRRKAAIRPR